MAEKYVVKVGNRERSFYNYDEAAQWFAENYVHGLVWSFDKYINGEIC